MTNDMNTTNPQTTTGPAIGYIPCCAPIFHGSLFSGIGGFDLAATWAGWNNVFQVEKDDWCRKVLAKNFPETKRFIDIKDFTGNEYTNSIDVISGGFPCQPFSRAGQRKGKEDDRYLWEEMLRVIDTIKPTWVIGENVAGLIDLALDTVLSDLEAQGYETETYLIPACSKNAWHRRDRIWIVAHAKSNGSNRAPNEAGRKAERQNRYKTQQSAINGTFRIIPNAHLSGCKEQRLSITNGTELFAPKCSSWWEAEPGVGRVVNGLPNRVDRLKGLGNAIVPQVAYEIFNAINLHYRS